MKELRAFRVWGFFSNMKLDRNPHLYRKYGAYRWEEPLSPLRGRLWDIVRRELISEIKAGLRHR